MEESEYRAAEGLYGQEGRNGDERHHEGVFGHRRPGLFLQPSEHHIPHVYLSATGARFLNRRPAGPPRAGRLQDSPIAAAGPVQSRGMGVREDRRVPAEPPAGLLARFRARGVRDLRDLDLRDRLGSPPAPLRLAVMVFALVILLGALAYVLGRTEGSWFGLVVTAVGVLGVAVAVGGALAITQYRHLEDLDRARDQLLALHAQIDALQQGSEARLHDARAIIGAMSAALHALVRAGNDPAIAGALTEELDRLRQVLVATQPAILVRVPAAVVCRSVESFARLREVPLVVDVPSDLMLLIDPTGITQILRNLIDNARKYAPGSPVRIGCEPAGPYARIFIEDDGPGIDAAVAETLFQSGVRGGGDAQGSGRGLAVARRLAEDMQGSLWFEPRNGGGARFVLKLKAVGPVPAAAGGEVGS